ncbi:MAG: class I SAM-dependent methyltransferase [Acidimicrobiia bacterium]|jgi:SAM-dependent methyltransferase|nr:class I SAM-dependent methyltransferase [Acidimicrobiia bacterium]
MTDAAPHPAAPSGLTSRSFTAWPAWADLSLDVVHYGPDLPTEAELRLLGRLEGKRVLELGCGGGPTAVALAKAGAKVIAVDSSTDQLGHARRLAEREAVNVELHHGDFADLAWVRGDTIDAVVSIYALGMVADVGRVFRQVHRVLRPDGPIVIAIPHPAWRALDPGDQSVTPSGSSGGGPHPNAGGPPTLRRPYFDRSPRPWTEGGESGHDHPLTVADLFTALTRANFVVDTMLEPEPVATAGHSRWWRDAMTWIPSTLIVRARKQGI